MSNKKLFTKLDPTDGSVYGDYADHEHDSALAHEMLPLLRWMSLYLQRLPRGVERDALILAAAPFLEQEE